MIFQDRYRKKKTSTDDKCYNYHNFGHFDQDYPLSDKRLNSIQHL